MIQRLFLACTFYAAVGWLLSFPACTTAGSRGEEGAADNGPRAAADAPRPAEEAPRPAEPSLSLSQAEAAAGWKLLFDGKTAEGWRGYRMETFPEKGWAVEDGCLHLLPGGGGDILTEKTYGDFELSLEWKATEGANSGVMFRVTEEELAPWQTGPEYQILDDAGAGAGSTDPHSAGALYDLYAPSPEKVLHPAGEWNQARIALRGSRLEHWLNGILVVDCDLTSPEYLARLEASKFHVFPKFGRNESGHIDLQDHGHELWFRNVKIRAGNGPLPGLSWKPLFNGKDLTGWRGYLEDGAKPEEVWSVQDGAIVCKGDHKGYLATETAHKDFLLRFQWRFSPVTRQAGNSGLLLRMTGEDAVWPRCIEAQLMSGDAGDFWKIGGFEAKTAPKRTEAARACKTHGAEHAVGQWNEMEVWLQTAVITVIVNGQVVNRAEGADHVTGPIALQSEGTEIHFRNIEIMSIDGWK